MEKTRQLHEILAVLADKEGTAKKVREEAIVTFNKKANHFQGYKKTLEMFNDERKKEESGAEENKPLVTTVIDKLEYVGESQIRHWDLALQQEATNQEAVADLTVDNKLIAEKLPATFLLGMESKLKSLRAVFDSIPTLDPSVEWKKDESLGKGVYRAATPIKAHKQERKKAHQVIVPATDHHPAQVETWDENVVVGAYNTETWSALISPGEKSDYLERIDTLIQAVKQARQRANATKIVEKNIGKELFKYIMNG